MKIKEVKEITDIKKGDLILVTGDMFNCEPFKVKEVKVTKIDGTEIIIDRKRNRFFNLGMYLEGKSWVKHVAIITH